MSHPAYRDIGSPIVRMTEECAEVLLAICKGIRFGWDNYHPDDPAQITNFEQLKREMTDLKQAFQDFKDEKDET